MPLLLLVGSSARSGGLTSTLLGATAHRQPAPGSVARARFPPGPRGLGRSDTRDGRDGLDSPEAGDPGVPRRPRLAEACRRSRGV